MTSKQQKIGCLNTSSSIPNTLSLLPFLEECTRPATVEQFHSIQREWCRKFDSYKSNMVKWQRWYENNVSFIF